MMKTVRSIVMTVMAAASLWRPLDVVAQGTNKPPVIVVPHDDKTLYQDLKGVPPAVRTLIVSFNLTRDKFLTEQRLLLARLNNATTPEEREAIRQLLQQNRQTFLSALATFRQQLKDELTALKGKISHEEFLKIIDAAHDAAKEGGIGHHKGH